MKIMFVFGGINFAVPFNVFGIFRFLHAKEMAYMVPKFMPGNGFLWVYILSASMVKAGLSIITRQQMFLTGFLLAVLLAMFIIFVYLPGLNNAAASQLAMTNLLKDLGLLGGALMVASDKK